LKVAVVGAGIVGACAARELSRRGASVTVYEQFPLGHKRGSSHGRSRIVRKAYPDPLFTRHMQDAYPLWRELESDLGKALLDECGLIYAGSPSSPDLQGCLAGLQECDVPHEVLRAPDLPARGIPYLLGDEEIAIHTPEAGWVRADVAVRGALELAVRSGASVRIERADPSQLAESYDAVLVAAGPWIREWAELPVRVTKQTVAYFAGKLEGPVWIEDGPDLCYGFPSEPSSTSHKIGIHRSGPPVEDLGEEQGPDPADIAVLSEASRRRFGFGGAPLESISCRYTTIHDERFLFGRWGDRGYFASACSGHGFKFGPWTGKRLALFALGEASPEDHPEFLWTGASA